jgi:hypothetical protein
MLMCFVCGHNFGSLANSSTPELSSKALQCTLGTSLEGQMSLSKKFPQQSRLFCSKRYDFIQSAIDLNLIKKFNLSLLI